MHVMDWKIYGTCSWRRFEDKVLNYPQAIVSLPHLQICMLNWFNNLDMMGLRGIGGILYGFLCYL